MLGSFFSKHGIKVAVVLLIAGAIYNYTSIKVNSPEGYQSYNVDNNVIFFNGEVEESLLQKIGTRLQEDGLFGKATKNIFIIDQLSKKIDSKIVFLVPIDPMKLSESVKKALAIISLDIKNSFLVGQKINACLVKSQDLEPIECYEENELIKMSGEEEQIIQQEQSDNKNENSNEKQDNNDNQSSSNQIIDRWAIGATKISNAKYYSPINQNEIWRIYYTEDFSEAAASIGASIFNNKLVSTQYYSYFALFSAKNDKFYNGETVYHFAIPFNKDELTNGQAELEAAKFFKVLKEGYMRDYKLIIALCDFDFNMVKVYTE